MGWKRLVEGRIYSAGRQAYTKSTSPCHASEKCHALLKCMAHGEKEAEMLSTILAVLAYLLVRFLIPILLLIGLGEWIQRRSDALRPHQEGRSGA